MSTGADYIRETWSSLKNGKSNKNKKDEATEEIENFISGYGKNQLPEKPRLPDVPEYERMEYDAPTDDAIGETAKKELESYKAQGESGIEKEIAALEKKYASDSEAARENNENAKKSVELGYEAAKRNTDSDMLKRGLARSSIAALSKAEIESEEASAKAGLDASLSRELNEISGKLGELSAKREEALNDFNLAYAAKLTQRITELKSERDKKVAEALKYNNTLAEKEHGAKVDKQMKESELYNDALSQKKKENELSGITESDYQNIYSQIAQKLRGLNAHDARDIVLNNPSVRKSLNNTYYYKLYDEFCR
ncbi:MAG: hypothetical protein HFE35_01120 [Clostridia bacterium]|nr:hypothetical protein [Clostridia bacterium]